MREERFVSNSLLDHSDHGASHKAQPDFFAQRAIRTKRLSDLSEGSNDEYVKCPFGRCFCPSFVVPIVDNSYEKGLPCLCYLT